MSSRNAVLNIGRLNVFRLNYRERPHQLTVTLDGAPLRIRANSMTIHDAINDAPNTCTFIVDHATPPTVGKRLRVELASPGASTPARLLFVGPIQKADRTYVGRPTVHEWHCEAMDDTPRADWLRPFGYSSGFSATAIANGLIANWCPGFTSNHVQAALPPVVVTFDGTSRVTDCLRLIAKLIGGYFYFEDYDLHLFTDAEPGETPDPVDGTPGRILDNPPIAITSDDAQIRTRCYGKGAGELTLAEVAASETIIPIRSTTLFNPTGGKAISEWQRFPYSGTDAGGAGALVGPGVTPSAPPNAVIANGAGITQGVHTWAYSWVTAAGETKPSPVSGSVTVTGAVAAPVIDYVSNGGINGGPPAGTSIRYQLFIWDRDGTGAYSPGSAILTLPSNGTRPVISFKSTADMRNRYAAVFRSDNGIGWIGIGPSGAPQPGSGTTPFPANYPIGISQNWTDGVVDYVGSADSRPSSATLMGPARVTVSGIAVGPPGTTARRVYRTSGAFGLLLVSGIFDNTTTTYLDSASDAALGAVPPATDTSGLQPTSGQVNAGATSIPLSSTAFARAGGGWLAVGNGRQIVRYTGISGNALTGIPASGVGAIVAPINFNSTVTGTPLLLGVTLAYPLRDGAPVNIWVQQDDTLAQTELAARVGGSGIVEQTIVDEERGETSMIALCNADLAMYSRPIITARYTTFDPKSRSGRPVRVVLPSLGIDTTLTILDVTITAPGDGTPARFTVIAGSVYTSLEDMLRRMVGTLEEGF